LINSQTFSPDWTKIGHIKVEWEQKHGNRSSQEPGVVLYSFYVQLLPINFVSCLNWKFDQKLNFHLRLAWTRICKCQIRPKQGENVVLKSRERYYIISIYKYYEKTLFLVLIGKFDQKSNFHPQLVWGKPYKSRTWPKLEENVAFKSRGWYYLVFMYIYFLLAFFLFLIT